MQCNRTESGMVCDVQLSSNIGIAEDYFDLATALKQQITSQSDTVIFHLAGEGGLIDGATYLTDLIRSLPGKTIMEVDGDVYSAHAVLALVGTQISVPSDGLFFFHASSGTKMEKEQCISRIFSMDRGHWGYTACIDQETQINRVQNEMLMKYVSKVLNKEEQAKVIQGETVVLSAEEIRRRLK
jgi:ATP-dependent protease ClpP protease subunit